MNAIFSFIFALAPIFIIISLALVFINKNTRKVKIDDNLSNKYKEMAYNLIKNNCVEIVFEV